MKTKIAVSLFVVLLAAAAIAGQVAPNGWRTWLNYDTDCSPQQVACSADGKTVYLIVKSERGSGKLLGSNDGGQTWRLIQP